MVGHSDVGDEALVMKRLVPTARRAALPLALAAVLALMAWDSASFWRAWRFNTAITSTDTAPTSHSEAPAVLFARAHRAAMAGRTQEALALYQAAARNARVASAAHYNSGNLHLREALALARDGELVQRPQSAELAKQRFRDALRADPSMWAAKYNLERALRLAPEGEDDDLTPALPQQSERALTNMRGFTLGLP
jgi:mxaK protein